MKRCPKCGKSVDPGVKFCPDCGNAVPGVEEVSLASEKTSLGEVTPEAANLVGETVFGYEIVEMVGAGGMGMVYRAVHPKIGKTVAIKFLPPAFSNSPQFVARFEREAVAMVRLSHPNIVTIENMGIHREQHFLIMEYVAGRTVSELLEADREAGGDGRFPWREAVRIAEQVLGALQSAHGQGMLHRDIKPGNILVADDSTVKVADFGLVKVMGIGDDVSIDEARSRLSISAVSDARGAGIGLTALGSPIGTFDYMSPEQYRGERDLDERTDVYSFGMTLYRMLTGRLARAFAKPPSSYCPDIPEELDTVCIKCLAEEPGDRFRNVAEIMEVLITIKKNAETALRKAAVLDQRQAEEERRRMEAAAESQRREAEEIAARRPDRKRRKDRKHSPEPERAPRKSGGTFKWIAVLLAVLTVAGGLFYAYHQEKDKRLAAERARVMAEQEAQDKSRLAVETEKQRIESERRAALQADVDRKKREEEAVRRQAEEERKRREAAARVPKPGQMKTVDLGGGVKLELVWVPFGEFTMGSPSSESGRDNDEGPQHRVRITRGFWMGKYEVTQSQWESVIGSNPSHFKDAGGSAPVESVSWDDCQDFLQKLSSRTGKTFRLPTEAEWEYACRAGTETTFHYGSSLSSTQANFNGNYPYGGASKGPYLNKTASVGSYRSNAFGLYDMHGNVYEWCQDWYGENYYQSSTTRDPLGPSSGSSRVRRGGSWNYLARYCRSAGRFGRTPDYRSYYGGFRIVLSASQD